MRVRKRLYGLFTFVALSLLSVHAAERGAYAPGRLLVGPRVSADAGAVRRALSLHRASVRRADHTGMQVVNVAEEGSAAAIEQLRNTGLFAYVERDYYAHTGAVPNDPAYPQQWYLSAIQAAKAWDLTTGAASMVVAVVDSGVDASHPELASKLVPGWSFLKNSADTSDTVGHGTAVAGTLAASSNNGAGGAGVTWGSAIMPLAVVDASDFATYSDIAAAIQYAADHGVRVINISLGGTNASAALQSAVDYAWSKGAVVFAAAMNSSSTAPNYPAACNHAVAVSATTSAGALADFSNFGNWIALSAPGANIFAPSMGGGYGYWYGTSFAAPVAAGVAALALSANPALTNAALVDLLERNADDLGGAGYDAQFGWGQVNAYRAVAAAAAAGSAPPPAPAPAPTPTPVNPAPVDPAPSGFTPILVNAGGPTYVDAQGRTWSADYGFTGGSTWATSAGIGNTTTPALYQSQRWGVFRYRFAVPNGTYRVTLKFAETSQMGMWQRLFDVTGNGAHLLAGFDIFSQAGGGNLALDKTFPIAVTDGTINLAFNAGAANWPELNAIEIEAASTFAPLRINAGGQNYTDVAGNVWSGDAGFSGGNTWATGQSIAEPTAPALYQTQRYGVFGYRFSVPNGSYLVKLKFAEISQMGVGQRVFDVKIDSAPALTSFDIFAQAGGGNKPLDKVFAVTVTNGSIAIDFIAGAANWPEVNGIEITAGGAALTTTTAPAVRGIRRARGQ